MKDLLANNINAAGHGKLGNMKVDLFKWRDFPDASRREKKGG